MQVLVAVLCCVLVLQQHCCARNMGGDLPPNWGPRQYGRMMKRLQDTIRDQAPAQGSGHPVGVRKGLVEPLESQWRPTLTLGEVVGVAVDKAGDPVVLHRGGRVWEPRSFNQSHHMLDTTKLPENTVVTLDKYSAQAKDSWGANNFLMPHGITIDPDDNIWITDVGLHQVIKFSGVNHHPLLYLGEEGVPGTDEDHFCQPTSTAVSSKGDVFVADGYCNNRVLRFSADGDLLGWFGQTGTSYFGGGVSSLSLPHGLALDESLDALCVADREGRRVVCFRAGLSDPETFGAVAVSIPEVHGRRVFDIASLGDGVVVGVGGSAVEGSYGVAFTADIAQETVLNLWRPREGLHNPHAVAVAPDGSALYIAEMSPNTVWKFSLRD